MAMSWWRWWCYIWDRIGSGFHCFIIPWAPTIYSHCLRILTTTIMITVFCCYWSCCSCSSKMVPHSSISTRIRSHFEQRFPNYLVLNFWGRWIQKESFYYLKRFINALCLILLVVVVSSSFVFVVLKVYAVWNCWSNHSIQKIFCKILSWFFVIIWHKI